MAHILADKRADAGLIGRNGTGRTTLLMVILGQVVPEQGRGLILIGKPETHALIAQSVVRAPDDLAGEAIAVRTADVGSSNALFPTRVSRENVTPSVGVQNLDGRFRPVECGDRAAPVPHVAVRR
ncbi:MAG: ATP-binding cassette domain-containing protein [Chloroflexota bacterium]